MSAPNDPGRPPPPKGISRSAGRLLFAATALLLVTFAAIPIAYHLIEFLRDEGAWRPPPGTSLAEGIALARGGQHAEAMQFFLRMLQRPARKVDGFTGMAYLRLRMGHREEAEGFCEEALRLDPTAPFARALRDLIREGAGIDRIDQALDALLGESALSASG